MSDFPVTQSPCCLQCEFYLMPDMVCRRFPPMIVVTKDDKNTSYRSAFPPLQPTGWCGEWKSTENPVEWKVLR